jgi:hypothetical protein
MKKRLSTKPLWGHDDAFFVYDLDVVVNWAWAMAVLFLPPFKLLVLAGELYLRRSFFYRSLCRPQTTTLSGLRTSRNKNKRLVAGRRFARGATMAA